MSKNYASKVVKIALDEVGYLEKKSNAYLFSKTDNAGRNNYNKFGYNLDKIKGFYNGRKNGTPWCCNFVDDCQVEAFGVDEMKRITNHTTLGSSCTYSMRQYQSIGRFYKTPKYGDEIFFGKGDTAEHTGLVVKVTGHKVHTVEGNTSPDKGVIPNGGQVAYKIYDRNDDDILGYGRPRYDAEPKPQPKPEPKPKPKKTVEQVAQEVLDGKWGNGAERKKRLTEAGYSYNAVQAMVNKLISIKAGDKVRVRKGAKTYEGKSLASFVYKRKHRVKSVKGKRAVITYFGIVVAAVNIDDLTKI